MERRNGAVFLTDRREIGKAMNFGKYPVLSMDIGRMLPDYNAYEGCKANVVSHTDSHGDLIYTGTLIMFGEDQTEEVQKFPQFWTNIRLKSYGACLKSDFGYDDVISDMKNAQAPFIKPNQEVIVVFDNCIQRCCYVRKMIVSSRFDPHCSTMLMLVNPKEAE